jgi:hypothetical protein
LGLEDNLNYTGNGEYGFDTVGLQIQNSGGPTLNHQVVAGKASKPLLFVSLHCPNWNLGIVTKDFMFGVFGLGPKPTNFSDFNDPQPSFMWSLRNQSIIPSASYGYSPGAAYVRQGVGASLILGGYDASRSDSNNLTVSFGGADNSPGLVVGLQSIQADQTLLGMVSLLLQGILALIDSTVPEIWLPTVVHRLSN